VGCLDAYDETELMTKISNKKYDFLLINIKMPGTNGIELIREIREIGIDVRIILHTENINLIVLLDQSELGQTVLLSNQLK